MVNTHYNLVHNHFDTADASSQRGKTSEAGLMAYAAYILERIQPNEGAKLLDVGCGDGLPMAMMKRMRPDLKIDGLDISENQAALAKVNNPESEIYTGNALNVELPTRKYNIAFSFSFLQYIPEKDLLAVQHHLAESIISKKRGGNHSLFYS